MPFKGITVSQSRKSFLLKDSDQGDCTRLLIEKKVSSILTPSAMAPSSKSRTLGFQPGNREGSSPWGLHFVLK
jgi:hypothetical protein